MKLTTLHLAEINYIDTVSPIESCHQWVKSDTIQSSLCPEKEVGHFNLFFKSFFFVCLCFLFALFSSYGLSFLPQLNYFNHGLQNLSWNTNKLLVAATAIMFSVGCQAV